EIQGVGDLLLGVVRGPVRRRLVRVPRAALRGVQHGPAVAGAPRRRRRQAVDAVVRATAPGVEQPVGHLYLHGERGIGEPGRVVPQQGQVTSAVRLVPGGEEGFLAQGERDPGEFAGVLVADGRGQLVQDAVTSAVLVCGGV